MSSGCSRHNILLLLLLQSCGQHRSPPPCCRHVNAALTPPRSLFACTPVGFFVPPAWYVHLPPSELDIANVVVPLSTRLMPLFEPSTTFECAVTDSVPHCCDVQINESIATKSLMATVAVEESVGLAFKGILSECDACGGWRGRCRKGGCGGVGAGAGQVTVGPAIRVQAKVRSAGVSPRAVFILLRETAMPGRTGATAAMDAMELTVSGWQWSRVGGAYFGRYGSVCAYNESVKGVVMMRFKYILGHGPDRRTL